MASGLGQSLESGTSKADGSKMRGKERHLICLPERKDEREAAGCRPSWHPGHVVQSPWGPRPLETVL